MPISKAEFARRLAKGEFQEFMEPVPSHVPEDQKRPDGSVKGKGFFGELTRPDGKVSTELSMGTTDVNGQETDIPTLVPTLTPEEMKRLLALPPDAPIPADIAAKATAYAQQRMSQGKPLFAQEGEQNTQLNPSVPRKNGQPPMAVSHGHTPEEETGNAVFDAITSPLSPIPAVQRATHTAANALEGVDRPAVRPMGLFDLPEGIKALPDVVHGLLTHPIATGKGLVSGLLEGAGNTITPADIALPFLGKAVKAVRGVTHAAEAAHDTFAILSAERSGLSAAQNAHRTENLLNSLRKMGFDPIPQKGVYNGSEEVSYYVPHLKAKTAVALGKHFDQEAIITDQGFHRLADAKVFPQTAFKAAPDAVDNFSEMHLPNGKVFKYQMDFPEEAYSPAPPKPDVERWRSERGAAKVIAPKPPAELLSLEHRSRLGDLTEVDPAKYGTGQAGAEKARASAPNFIPRSYYDVKGGPVEGRFRGLPTYDAQVEAATVYDMNADPLGLIPDAQRAAKGDDMAARTIFENLVKSQGYRGYKSGTTVAYFDPLPVTKR